MTNVLTPAQEAILAFEAQWFRYSGAKEAAIMEAFDMTAARYFQEVNYLIDQPAALAFDPLLVNRLRRMRAERAARRSFRSV